MNPLHLRGPEFLLFFAALSIAAIFLQKYLCEKQIPNQSARISPTDPYLLAFLARGPVHSINTAALSLIERKLLEVNGSVITLGRPDAKEFARRSLEKSIIDYFSVDTNTASKLTVNADVRKVATRYESKLVKAGLFPSKEHKWYRTIITLVLLTLLMTLAGLKILFALISGHTHIVLLMILAFVVLCVLQLRAGSRLTIAGDQILKTQKSLYKKSTNFKAYRKIGESPDMVFAFALFGLSVLPAEAYAWQKALKPEKTYDVSSGSSSSCSSCSSYSSYSSYSSGTSSSDSSSSSDSGSGSSCGSSCGGCGGGGCG